MPLQDDVQELPGREARGRTAVVCVGGVGGGEGSKENRGVGRPFWIPAKMIEEGVAFPSLPTLPLPGKQGTWRLWLFSPVGNQILEQMHSQAHTEKRIKLGFIQTPSPPHLGAEGLGRPSLWLLGTLLIANLVCVTFGLLG